MVFKLRQRLIVVFHIPPLTFLDRYSTLFSRIVISLIASLPFAISICRDISIYNHVINTLQQDIIVIFKLPVHQPQRQP